MSSSKLSNKIKGISILSLLSLMAISIITTSAFAENSLSASNVVDKVQNYYESTSDYTARFVQTTAHKMFPGKYQRAYGTVSFKKGGFMRWEYTRPSHKYFIYDTKTLWIYEPEVPQIFQGSDQTDKLKNALAFLTGEGKIKDFYTVKEGAQRSDFKNGYVVYLFPKTNSPFKRVELYINKNSFSVERSIVVDHDDNRNRLDFYGSKTNTGLNSSLFTFTPPKGVPVMTQQ
jgi:outer membrane lipoprotein carrier protein